MAKGDAGDGLARILLVGADALRTRSKRKHFRSAMYSMCCDVLSSGDELRNGSTTNSNGNTPTKSSANHETAPSSTRHQSLTLKNYVTAIADAITR